MIRLILKQAKEKHGLIHPHFSLACFYMTCTICSQSRTKRSSMILLSW